VGDPLFGLRGEAEPVAGKVTALFHFEGLKQIQIEEAHAGDIVGNDDRFFWNHGHAGRGVWLGISLRKSYGNGHGDLFFYLYSARAA